MIIDESTPVSNLGRIVSGDLDTQIRNKWWDPFGIKDTSPHIPSLDEMPPGWRPPEGPPVISHYPATPPLGPPVISHYATPGAMPPGWKPPEGPPVISHYPTRVPPAGPPVISHYPSTLPPAGPPVISHYPSWYPDWMKVEKDIDISPHLPESGPRGGQGARGQTGPVSPPPPPSSVVTRAPQPPEDPEILEIIRESQEAVKEAERQAKEIENEVAILPERREMGLDKREREKIRGYFTWHAVIMRDGKPVAGVEVELLNGSAGNPFGERGIIEGLGIDEALGRGRTDSQGRVAISIEPLWGLLDNSSEKDEKMKEILDGVYAKVYAPGLPVSKSFFRGVWPTRIERIGSARYFRVKAPTISNPYFINLPPTTKGAGWEEYLPYILGGVGVLGIGTLLFLTLKK